MKARLFACTVFAFLVVSAFSFAYAAQAPDFPQNSTFTTKAITPFAIEGLTGDATGNLYTTGRQPDPNKKCPVWRIKPNGQRVTVGFIPNNPLCNPSGITFDSLGNLYIADAASTGTVWKVSPDANGCNSDDSTHPSCASVPTATAFATGVPGTNGLAFDKNGNLFTGDGTTGDGRVWKISPQGGNCTPATLSGCVELFRIQAMANVLNPAVSSGVSNVGRDNRALPLGTINAARQATNLLGSQPLVANGLAFNPDGVLFNADTARGAIWKIEFNSDGSLKSQTGCDTTFTPNTLCLDNVFVAHPFLEGTDGIALDTVGNIWNSANERNAIVVVTPDKEVIEIFRNEPDGTTKLRNTGPLEFPTSPFLLGKTFCTSNSDGNRRDNSPNSAGEVNQGGPVGARGKISCMDQELTFPGLTLPVQ